MMIVEALGLELMTMMSLVFEFVLSLPADADADADVGADAGDSCSSRLPSPSNTNAEVNEAPIAMKKVMKRSEIMLCVISCMIEIHGEINMTQD